MRMTDDRKYYENKSPLKTYVSRVVEIKGDDALRIASKVFDSATDFDHVVEKGSVAIHATHGGRREIVAKFWENERGLQVLTIRAYRDGNSSGATSFSFVGGQISRLTDFLDSIRAMPIMSNKSFSFSDYELSRMKLSQEQVEGLLKGNAALLAHIVRNDVTVGDVQALGYRREQLRRFDRLLREVKFFNDEKAHLGVRRDEDVWQRYFEANKWIFGFGLSLVVLGALDDRALEQIVRGTSLSGPGKEADAVLKTHGIISSLSFVEIKTHNTKLLAQAQYRPGVYASSSDLSGAVAQSHSTVYAALENIRGRLEPVRSGGAPTGEILYGIKPRSFVIAGLLSEFETEHGVNEQKFRSFEMYRRSLREPEVITFDELYHRARYIVEHSIDD